MRQEDISENDLIECWLNSPTLEERLKEINEYLSYLAQEGQDSDTTNVASTNVKPRLRLFKFTQFLVNIVIRHILNNNETDFIVELKQFHPEEYALLNTISQEIHETLQDTLFGIDYTCLRVDIFEPDMIRIEAKI